MPVSATEASFIATAAASDPLAEARAELRSLDRVANRLAALPGDRLPQVLDPLLPRLLRRLAVASAGANKGRGEGSDETALRDAHAANRGKLVDLLAHVMKRARADTTCRLPCRAVLELLIELRANSGGDAYTVNLSLVLLAIGVPRCPAPVELLPSLLELFGTMAHETYYANAGIPRRRQADQLAQLLLGALEATVGPPVPSDAEVTAAAASSPPTTPIPAMQSESWRRVKALLRTDAVAAATLYDLLLDVVLASLDAFVPTSPAAPSAIPPPGLSAAGAHRLRGAAASSATGHHYSRLAQCILDLVAPAQPWALFLDEDGDEGSSNAEIEAEAPSSTAALATPTKSLTAVNRSRTLAMLVAASGHPTREVAQHAHNHLRMYFDALGNRSVAPALGDPLTLVLHLLALCVGEQHAAASLRGAAPGDSLVDLDALSARPMPTAVDALAAVLNASRRPVAEATLTELARFVATRVFQDLPGLFNNVDDAAAAGNRRMIVGVATLVVQLAQRTLSNGALSPSGLSRIRGRPFVVTAELLNALVVRLATFYDGQTDESRCTIVGFMAQSMSVACSVLRGVAGRPPQSLDGRGVVDDEGNIAVRNALYGIVCTLSRSQFTMAPQGYIFCIGESMEVLPRDQTSVSIKTAQLLFGCVSNEEEKLRHRAMAALEALLMAYSLVYKRYFPSAVLGEVSIATETNPWAGDPAQLVVAESTSSSSIRADQLALVRSLTPLLWTVAQGHLPKASRVSAVHWAGQLLKKLDLIKGCHLLCFLAGDVDPAVASVAREGLGLKNMEQDKIPTVPENSGLPGFVDLVSTVFANASVKNDSVERQQCYWEFSHQGKIAALRLGVLTLLNDFYEANETSMFRYLSIICTTVEEAFQQTSGSLNARGSVELLDESSLCLRAAVSSSQFMRHQLLNGALNLGLAKIVAYSLEAESSRARRHFSYVCGQLYEDSEYWGSKGHSPRSFDEWAASSCIDQTLTICEEKLALIRGGIFSLGQVHGSAFLSGTIVRAVRLQAMHEPMPGSSELWSRISAVLIAMSSGIQDSDDVIGNACADALSIALSFEGLDAPTLDERLLDSVGLILLNLSKAMQQYDSGNTADVLRIMKLTKASGICLGSSARATGIVRHRVDCVNALFGLLGSNAFRQNEELGLLVGEAVAQYSDTGGPHGSARDAMETAWSSEYNEGIASRLPPHQHALYVLLKRYLIISNPSVRTASAPVLLAVVARVARGMSIDNDYASRPLPMEITQRLSQIQFTFISLLSDPKIRHLSRESCCLGLVACHGIAKIGVSEETGDDLNQRLLSAFGQTTHFAGSAMMETPQQAAVRRAHEGADEASIQEGPGLMERFGFENEVGGVANLGEAALGAYREMAAASISLGREDLLYALLALSISHPCWLSIEFRDLYGASSLLGPGHCANTKEMRFLLKPFMRKLIPRVLRARYDPNRQTREQMASLWNGLTGGGAEARNVITQHFTTIIDSLLQDASSKLWRARHGALGALADVITGREWSELGGGGAILDDDDMDSVPVSAGVRLLRLWKTATRGMDDVRGAVREVGETLARAVKAFTISLCNQHQASYQRKRIRDEYKSVDRHDAAAATATSLRWLCRHGLNQPCAEATGICVSTLIGIISLPCVSTLLRPVLPELIKSLLLAMSGLEPAALNFLQLRTSNQEGLERIRLQLAHSGPLAIAVAKCLDIVPKLDVADQQAIVSQLDAALRQSAGFATRAAVADAVSTLCSTCPAAFRSSGSTSINPSVRLLRALYYASEKERGDGSKNKMIHALGNLAALCPGATVRSLAIRACQRYLHGTGSNDDPISRRSSAAILKAIATRASDQFSDGRVWGEKILPTAFLGQKDTDKTTASHWKDVWDEGGSAFMLSDYAVTDTFGSKLEEKILDRLVRACTHALRDVSWSRRITGATALTDLVDLGVLEPIIQEGRKSGNITGSTAEQVNRNQYRAQTSSLALRECVSLISKPRLWTGKGCLIEAAVRLASKWSFLAFSTPKDFQENSGLDFTSILKPVVATDEPNDLFLGDEWFRGREEIPNLSLIENEKLEAATDGSGIDDKVEFSMDECDAAIDDVKLVVEENAMKPTDDDNAPVSLSGLCRLLLCQALTPTQNYFDYSLPYRVSAFKGLRDLLVSLAPTAASKNPVFSMLTFSLLGVLEREVEKPLILTAALDCLVEILSKAGLELLTESAETSKQFELFVLFDSLGGPRQSAWTVRQSSSFCMAKLVKFSGDEVLRQPSTIMMIVRRVEASRHDKFWKVRLAGVQLLQELIARVGSRTNRLSLIFEAVLPHKEEIVRLLKENLRDSEAAVTALSNEVLEALSWWP